MLNGVDIGYVLDAALRLSFAVLVVSAVLFFMVYMLEIDRDRAERGTWTRWQEFEARFGFRIRRLLHHVRSKCGHCGADNSSHGGDFCAYCGSTLVEPALRTRR
jgi:hypothetical protein